MNGEVKDWWLQAQSDLKAAHNSINSGNFDWACFQAQQAAEKALKALYLKKFKELRKVHDLVFLARKLQLPKNLSDYCVRLNKVYVETRYPAYGKIPAQNFINPMLSSLRVWLRRF